MKSNINKLILIEVIAGILFAFIASKILHMTVALQIMYLPFELIGKGLRFLSLSSAIGNVIAIIIYVHQSRTHVSENARHFFNGPE